MLTSALVAFYLWQIYTPPSQTRVPQPPADFRLIEHRRGTLVVTPQPVHDGSVPPGAQRVPMLRLSMTASCEADVSVDALHVVRKGLGSVADVDAVYVMENSLRLTAPLRIGNRSGTVDFSLRSFTVPACGTKEIVLYANFSQDAEAAGEHRFELAGEAVESLNADVHVRAPLTHFSVETTGTPVGRVTAEYLKPTQSINYGARQTVGRFSLMADGKADEAVSAITFHNDGSARGNDLQNIYAEFRSDRITSIARSMNGSSVRLSFDPPLMIKKNQKIVIALRADVRTGYSRTIRFLIEEPSDIEATPAVGR